MYFLNSNIITSPKPFLLLCWNSYIKELSCKQNSGSPAVLMTSVLVRGNNNSAIRHGCVLLWGFPEPVLFFLSFVVPTCLVGSLLHLEKRKPRCQDVRAGPKAVQWAWAPTRLPSCVVLGSLLSLSVSHCSPLQSMDHNSIFLLGCCEELMG